MSNRLKSISPLALLALAACKSEGSSTAATSPASTTGPSTSAGKAVNGPLHNALAFVDLNGNKAFDAGETSTLTAADGSYSLSNPGGHQIVIQAIEGTVNGSTGAQIRGITLVGDAGSTLITPLTTLATVSGVDVAQLATALGLDGVDLLTYNPYAAGVSETDATALAVAKAAASVSAILQVTAGALVGQGGAGAPTTLSEGFEAAFNALATVISDRLESGDELMEFGADFMAAAGITGPLATTLANQISDIQNAIENVTTLSKDDDGLKDAFTAGSALASVYEEDFDAADDLDYTEVTGNAAPTAISLGADPSVDERDSGAPVSATPILVGAISVTDDTSTAGQITFVLSGDDAAKFEVTNGQLFLKAGNSIDAEQTDSLKVNITATDHLGKSIYQTFDVAVNNVDEATTGTLTISGQGKVGTTLYINDTLRDDDNLVENRLFTPEEDLFSQKFYNWFANGDQIEGQFGSTLNVTSELAGKNITATINTIDQRGGEPVVTTGTFGLIAPEQAAVTITLHEGLDTVPDALFDAAATLEQAYLDTSDLSGRIDPLLNAFNTNAPTISVTSDGITAVASGYTIEAIFENFNPTSLAELEAVVNSFDGTNLNTLQVSGGFKEIKLHGPNGTIMRLELDEDADGSTHDSLRLVNVGAQGQTIKTIGLTGEFDGQIGNFLDVLDQIQASSDPDTFAEALDNLAVNQDIDQIWVQLGDSNRPYFELDWGDNGNGVSPDQFTIRLDGYQLGFYGDFPELPSQLLDMVENSIVPIQGLFDFNDTSAALQAFIEGAASVGLTDLDSIQLGRDTELNGVRDWKVFAEIIIDDFENLVLNYQDIDGDGETTGTFNSQDFGGDFENESVEFILDDDGMYLILGDGVDLDSLFGHSAESAPLAM